MGGVQGGSDARTQTPTHAAEGEGDVDEPVPRVPPPDPLGDALRDPGAPFQPDQEVRQDVGAATGGLADAYAPERAVSVVRGVDTGPTERALRKAVIAPVATVRGPSATGPPWASVRLVVVGAGDPHVVLLWAPPLSRVCRLSLSPL